MRALVIIVTVASLLWGGWWVVASRAARQAAQAWFDSAPERGLSASQTAIGVRGFPNRVDLRIEAPTLGLADGSLRWSSPFFEVFALTYQPWHLIAVPAPRQDLRLPAGGATLLTEDARASLVLKPRRDLALDRLTVVMQAPVLTPDAGGTLRAETLRAALHAVDAPPGVARYQLGVQARGLRLDDDVMGWIGPAAARLPGLVEVIGLDATLDLTAPLSAAAAGPRPQIAAIEIAAAQLQWGSLALTLRGRVTPDAAGRAEGTLELRIEDWPAALDLARRAGLIAPKDLRSLEALLNGLAPVARDGGRLSLPLRLAEGVLRLGPLVLGPAPRL